MVEPVNVSVQFGPELIHVRESSLSEKFFLEVAKEVLGNCVVQTVALSRHGLLKASRLQLIAIGDMAVMPPLIGMNHGLGILIKGGQRLVQHRGDKAQYWR